MESWQQSHFLERQQARYRDMLEALGKLSKPSDQRRLERQLQRQRLKQRLLQHRERQQLAAPQPWSRLTPSTARIQGFRRAQRHQQLHFKIEIRSWRYPIGMP